MFIFAGTDKKRKNQEWRVVCDMHYNIPLNRVTKLNLNRNEEVTTKNQDK